MHTSRFLLLLVVDVPQPEGAAKQRIRADRLNCHINEECPGTTMGTQAIMKKFIYCVSV